MPGGLAEGGCPAGGEAGGKEERACARADQGPAGRGVRAVQGSEAAGGRSEAGPGSGRRAPLEADAQQGRGAPAGIPGLHFPGPGLGGGGAQDAQASCRDVGGLRSRGNGTTGPL